MGSVVVVTGAAGPLGRRVVEDAAADPSVARVVALDPALAPSSRRAAAGQAEVRVAPFALGDPRIAAAVAGATELVHLGPAAGPELDGTGGSLVDVDGFEHLLGVLGRVASVGHVVLVSTALVYGARNDNPVPLTEDAPVRPDPWVPAAVAKAELERLARMWATDNAARCTVLRPSLVVGAETGRWLSRSPWSGTGLQVARTEAPVQFLHLDDLASAVDVVRHHPVDGVVNVAPDGWLTAEELKALKGPTLRLRLPRAVAVLLARMGTALPLGRGHPAAVAASAAPWVVANDRLRAVGWAPTHTCAEAFVEADPGGPWARLTPRDRQLIALGGLGAVLAGAGVTALLVVRHLRRRTR